MSLVRKHLRITFFVLAYALLVLSLAAGALLLSAPPAKATSTVTLTTDTANLDLTDDRCDVSAVPGLQCTLRAAIRQANDTPGVDTIHFNIPGGGVKTIRSTADPFITEPVTINGYAQPGAKPNTRASGTNAVLKIQLDGTSNPEGDGLRIHAPGTVVRGLAIGGFHEGIQIHRALNQSGAHEVHVSGCFIGTNAAGTRARSNQTGVEVHTSHVSVGGDRLAARNLISGNAGDGVQLLNEAETGARVLGNLIGTDRTGAHRLGNGRSGIRSEQSEGRIGGDQVANTANTIKFNASDGGANSTQNHPVITVATTASVQGTLHSTPNSTFSVRLFSNLGARKAGSSGAVRSRHDGR